MATFGQKYTGITFSIPKLEFDVPFNEISVVILLFAITVYKYVPSLTSWTTLWLTNGTCNSSCGQRLEASPPGGKVKTCAIVVVQMC